MQEKINKIRTPQLKKWGLLVIPLKRLEGRTTPFALNVVSADSSARVAWRAISEWSWRHVIAIWKRMNRASHVGMDKILNNSTVDEINEIRTKKKKKILLKCWTSPIISQELHMHSFRICSQFSRSRVLQFS